MISDIIQHNFGLIVNHPDQIALVACDHPDHPNDPKAKIYTLCIVKQDQPSDQKVKYSPVAIMQSYAFNDLMDRLVPPASLQGDWNWMNLPNSMTALKQLNAENGDTTYDDTTPPAQAPDA